MERLFPDPRPVISASRRTDLARCFPERLSRWLKARQVMVPNPFNRTLRTVDLSPERVHTLVFWSKDYSRLLANENGLLDQVREYAQLFFHLTLTGLGGTRLEPGVAPPAEIARQWEPLVKLAGDPGRVNWRLDPLVAWREGTRLQTNLRTLDAWLAPARAAGIGQVTLAWCQPYAKALRRFERAGLALAAPTTPRLRTLARWIMARATRAGLQVRACCSAPLREAGIPPAACVDGAGLTRLHPLGWEAPLGKDAGQRPGCGCTPSVDIGDYALSCPQGCLYCYANPKTNF